MRVRVHDRVLTFIFSVLALSGSLEAY